MIDIETFLDSNTLPIFIPVIMIIIAGLTTLVPVIKAYIKKKRSEKRQTEKRTKPRQRINFRSESAQILTLTDSDIAIRKLSSLIKQFLTQLLNIDSVLTFQETKNEAQACCFNEIAELCDMLSAMNFARDSHSRQDLIKLNDAFNNVLDLYEAIIIEDWQLGKYMPDSAPANNRFLNRIKRIIGKIKLKQFEQKLHTTHPHLFKIGRDDSPELMGKEDTTPEMLKLISRARIKLNKMHTQTADGIYSRILRMFRSLPASDKNILRSYIEELHANLLNAIGRKASYEIMLDIRDSINSQDYVRLEQLFQQLKYIYKNLRPDKQKEVYRRWTAFLRNIQ